MFFWTLCYWVYVLDEDFYNSSDCTHFPLRRLYLDEVSAYAFIVCGGDQVFMLRNKLQTFQHFVLRPTEIWTAHAQTCWYCQKGTTHMYLFQCLCCCCVYLCLRAVVILTAMFSHAALLSPLPGVLQPSRNQHSSKTQSHLCSAGTANWPNLLQVYTIQHFN